MFTLEALLGSLSLIAFLVVLFVALKRLGARELAAALLVVCGIFFAFSAAVSSAALFLN